MRVWPLRSPRGRSPAPCWSGPAMGVFPRTLRLDPKVRPLSWGTGRISFIESVWTTWPSNYPKQDPLSQYEFSNGHDFGYFGGPGIHMEPQVWSDFRFQSSAFWSFDFGARLASGLELRLQA